MMFSRRQFLTIAGITLLGLKPEALLASALDFSAQYGRALDTLLVRTAPQIQSSVIKHIWADSILRLLSVKDDWLQIADGYVERSTVQMMLPYTPEQMLTLPQVPFWAEVAAPVAAVRAWCAADAPLITRIGHGGVLRVTDALPNAWYAVESDQGTHLGWTQAILWQAVPSDVPDLSNARLEINLSKHELYIYDDDHRVMSTPIATGQALQTGVYKVQRRQTGATHYDAVNSAFYGTPWRIGFDEYELAGAYWHNQFGKSHTGTTVQMSPIAARWVYRQMQEDSTVVVIA
jgi:hypothetical protein